MEDTNGGNYDERLGGAVLDGDVPRVRALLQEEGVNINARVPNYNDYGATYLHLACRRGDLAIARMLIDNGADVDAKENMFGDTPMNMTCRYAFNKSREHWGVIELLIRAGADTNAQGNDGATPLHYACLALRLDIVTLLIQNGADVSAKTIRGRTPLFLACRNECLEIVEYLIEQGANLNAIANGGQTPLYQACVYGQSEVVQFLLTKGTNVTIETPQGKTPLHIACERNHSEIVWLLVRQNVGCGSF